MILVRDNTLNPIYIVGQILNITKINDLENLIEIKVFDFNNNILINDLKKLYIDNNNKNINNLKINKFYILENLYETNYFDENTSYYENKIKIMNFRELHNFEIKDNLYFEIIDMINNDF